MGAQRPQVVAALEGRRVGDRVLTDAAARLRHRLALALDPPRAQTGSHLRSANISTEIGVFVDSPAVAQWGAELLERQLPAISYCVRLDAEEEIEWVDAAAEGAVVYPREPKAGGWRRFQAWLYGLFPIEQEL